MGSFSVHLIEEIDCTRHEGTSEHGIVHQPRAGARELLDAVVVDLPAEDMLFEVAELQPTCHATMSALMIQHCGQLCGVFVGIDEKKRVDLELDGLNDDTVEVE